MFNAQTKKFRITVFAVLASISLLAMPQSAKAYMSWPDITGFTYGHMLRVAYETFMNTLIANLKIQAANLLRGRIEALLTGSSSTPLFITNYQEFIYASAQTDAQLLVGNLFSSLTSGVSGSTQKMLHGVEQNVNNEIFKGLDGAKSTIDEYVHGGLDNMFKQSSGGGLAAFNAALDNPYNNPYGAYLATSHQAMKEMAMKQDVNRTQAMSNRGYIGKKDPKTNLIQTPGDLIAELTSFAESLPMRITAYARSIPEVIGTMAAQTLSQAIQNGISKVTKPIDNQLININNTVKGGVNGVQSQIYNGIKFTGDTKFKLPLPKGGSNITKQPPSSVPPRH